MTFLSLQWETHILKAVFVLKRGPGSTKVKTDWCILNKWDCQARPDEIYAVHQWLMMLSLDLQMRLIGLI